MNGIEYKKQIAKRILSRAETGLYFIEDFLFRHNAADGAYFRSLLILFSYSFELVLKSQLVIACQESDRASLEKRLKYLGHSIEKIIQEFSEGQLRDLGIQKAEARVNSSFLGYIITTKSGNQISIEDFVDVRYDFLKDSLRDLPKDEDVKIWIREIKKIIKAIRELNSL